jgi:uncharacterized DUF497 family protein
MAWAWDPRKDAANRAKHGVPFFVAELVFADPLHLSRPDPFPDEERWQTLGYVGAVCLFVVHTGDEGPDGPGRIISARRATPSERKWYEEGD